MAAPSIQNCLSLYVWLLRAKRKSRNIIIEPKETNIIEPKESNHPARRDSGDREEVQVHLEIQSR